MLSHSKFSAHGEHYLEIKGSVVFCKVIGAWNAEQAERFVQELIAVIKTRLIPSRQPWIRIVDMSEWELSTPDAQKCVKDYLEWEQTKNCSHRIYCGCSKVQKTLVSQKYEGYGRLTFTDCAVDGEFCAQKLCA